MIFDQSRGGVGVEVVQYLGLADVNLAAAEHGRYRNHHREFARIAAIIILHGHHGAVIVPCEDHARAAVEEASVRLGDEEAAEGRDTARPGGGDDEC